jgi:L-asparagine oxygenase
VLPAKQPEIVTVLELEQDERDQLDDIVKEIVRNGVPHEQDLFEVIRPCIRLLPARLFDALLNLRHNEDHYVLLVRGRPPKDDEIGPTPLRYRLPQEVEPTTVEIRHGLMAAVLGEPFGFTTQQFGRLFNDIVPLPEEREVPNLSSGSRFKFKLHTEDAFHPFMPDWFSLVCLRDPQEVATVVSWPDWRGIPVGVQQILFEPRYQIHANPAQGGSRSDPNQLMAILFGHPRNPFLRLNTCITRYEDYSDPATREALELLTGHLESREQPIYLRPGDSLFVDNYRVLHAREEYEPRFDGTDRWLKRLVIASDLRQSRAHRSGSRSRVVHLTPIL